MNTTIAKRLQAAQTKASTIVLTAHSAADKVLKDVEDFKLLQLMNSARSEGLADTQETLTKLGLAVC
jgi:predicted component of type VI protein secretion system